MQSQTSRHIVMVIFPRAQILDITGPLEVFSQAAKFLGSHGPPAYLITLTALEQGPVTMSSGLKLCADKDFKSFSGKAPVDTLLVPGGSGVYEARDRPGLTDFVLDLHSRARRTASICSGTFILARAGLLDRRRATTHWSVCSRLETEHPGICLEPDKIFVKDGSIYSSAGVTAGIDLALALVEEDHGRELALKIAKQLVVFMKRQGGQSQFSTSLVQQSAQRGELAELLDWIKTHPGEDLSVQALAGRSAMSERNFARIFKKEIGISPGKYVEKLRVELATRQMEKKTMGLKALADASGFKSEEMMRRAFKRQLNVLPHIYYKRFGRISHTDEKEIFP